MTRHRIATALCVLWFGSCTSSGTVSPDGAVADGAVDSGDDGRDASGGARGTGGLVGSGGATGSGGKTGSGGAAGSGGKTGSGGITGSGGKTGSGGVTGSGGKTGSGGITGSGGKTGSGGGGGSGGAAVCTPPASGTQGKNPLFTDQYTADPAAMVHNCTFYIQCGHDEGATGFVMREWFLLSSTDMVNWTKAVALRLSDFKWANANAWAGQMVRAKNGKFYWYVPVQEAATGAMAIGVAVADSPTGPFQDALGKPLINDAFEMSNMGLATPSDTPYTIDPTVFIDDDGQAYLQYGGFWRLVTAKLNADMLSINGAMKQVTPPDYFESPYLIKRNGVYYELYAAGSNPTTIDYATSSSPFGPWTRKGIVLDKMPGVVGQDAPTNHAGIAELAGQWYIVYHVSNGPNGGGTYRREVAVDKLTFNPDGTIQKVTPTSGMKF